MLIGAQHLVDRLRHERQRAAELLELRRRLAALPGPSEVSAEMLALARELRELRERLALALGAVESCSSCAVGHPLPFGKWSGGHCCGGATDRYFSDHELHALALAGTTAARLRAPRGEQAGCAFRGPDGCSLSARDRPNLCTRFVCRELERELTRRGALAAIAPLQEAIRVAFDRFVELREQAAEDALFGPEDPAR